MTPASGLVVDWLDWFLMVYQHPARNKYVSGGRGIQKTTHGIEWLVAETLDHKWQGTGIITAPTRVESKRLHWRHLIRFMNNQPIQIMKSANATDMTVELIDGKSIALFGMKEFESLRGIHPIACFNDEVAKSPMRGFQEVLDIALTNHKAKTLDCTTPRRGWWQARWAEGWGPKRKEGKMSWKIPQWDIGTVDPADLEEQRRTMSPELFAQEWGAEFTSATGLVFPQFVNKEWSQGGHLMPPGLIRQEMERGGYPMGALDWGYSKSNAVLLWLWITKNGGVIVLDELVCRQKTPAQMIQAAAAKRKLPPRIMLDSQCWSISQITGHADGRSIAEGFQRAGRKYGAAFMQADKRFPPSLVRINEIMTMDEDTEKFPNFAIEIGKAPQLCVELGALQEEHIRAGGGGFRDNIDCDAADAFRYGVMGARGGVTVKSSHYVDPEVARLRLKPVTRADVEEDEIIGWDDNSGVPIFKGEAADA